MANHYDLLGINKEELNKKTNEEEISKLIENHFQIKLDRNKNSTATAQQKKELEDAYNIAYNALIDKAKREEYNEQLKNMEAKEKQHSIHIYPQGTDESVQASADKKQRSFLALASFKDIKKEFDDFVKETTGKANAEGYTSTEVTDQKTGSKTLILTFPTKEAADAFINRLLNKNMIKPIDLTSEKRETPKP